MTELPDGMDIRKIRELAEWGRWHHDCGVNDLATGTRVLDALCLTLFRALGDPELRPSAAFAFRELYV